MLKSICVICLLVAGALPLATLIRLCKNKISVALGYISAMLVHTMIFTSTVPRVTPASVLKQENTTTYT